MARGKKAAKPAAAKVRAKTEPVETDPLASLYDSTIGLSMYNMLSLARRDLTLAEILDALRRRYQPKLTMAHMERGLSALTAPCLAKIVDGKLRPANRKLNGECVQILKDKTDETKLISMAP